MLDACQELKSTCVSMDGEQKRERASVTTVALKQVVKEPLLQVTVVFPVIIKMNFEWFCDLQHRLVREWFKVAKKLSGPDFDLVQKYLQDDPSTSRPTPDNEQAYELLMDARMKLYELSYEIDVNHDDYMALMQYTSDSPDLMTRLTTDLSLEERNLLELELMIMEQVAEWETDNGRMKAKDSTDWHRTQRLVVHLPDKTTRTLCLSYDEERRFWPSVCPVTFKQGHQLKLCSGCRVVRYFSGKEQKADWPKHKSICKIIKEQRGQHLYWQQTLSRDQMRRTMLEKLARALTQYETDIIDYSPTCLVCDEANDDLAPFDKYHNAFFCSKHMHQAPDHLDTCQQLQQAADNYCNAMVIGHQAHGYRPERSEVYHKLAEDMEAFFNPILPLVVSNKLEGYQLSELHYLSFLYTCPLTLLYGCEALGPDFLADRKELVVHLVGARRAETRFLEAWQLLALRLPSLRNLHLVFIGDECDNELPSHFSFVAKELQTSKTKKQVNFHFVKKCLYQDFIANRGQKHERVKRPDVIVAFDCGFKFYPEWRPALQIIGERLSNTPVIFTEFTKDDMDDNVALVNKLMPNVQLVLGARANPFSSLAPVRCRESLQSYRNKHLIFTNDYICVLRA